MMFHNYKIYKQEIKTSDEIDLLLKNSRQQSARQMDLAIFGLPGCGATTLIKQLRVVFSGGFLDEERRKYIPLIQSICLQYGKDLVQEIKNEIPDEFKTHIDDIIQATKLTNEIAQIISSIWELEIVIEKVENFSLSLPYSSNFFLDRTKIVLEEDYIPTDQDILNFHDINTSTQEYQAVIDNNLFLITEVSHFHSMNKKWKSFFEDSDGIFFVVDVSDYDKPSPHNPHQTCLHDALDFFSQIAVYYPQNTLYLLLNKCDILEKKILKKSFSKQFPDYHGNNK
eukprot:c18455_g1_i2.p1 GENE.c18455_g1_i2~~c18455_g1_i2.p1  ORF type:complete len:283 (+),score=73.73 c18455_g1_i2:30-878(+)